MERSTKLQGEGARDTLAGKLQKTWGKLTKSPHHQVEGTYKMAKGKLRMKTAEALQALKDMDDEE